MKLFLAFAAAVGFLVFPSAAFSQSYTSSAPDDPEALTLLQRMLDAQKQLNISGEQVTILYRPEQTFTATESIERQGDHDLRLEYHSPAAVDGEVYVDNGRVSYHSIPSTKELEVGPSELYSVKRQTNAVYRSLTNHQLTVHLIGHDIVAGQIAQVIQVTASSSSGEKKYWIDPVTGAQLKIQSFGAMGQMVSETYFTQIDYVSSFPRGEFGPPKVDSGYEVTPLVPEGSTTIGTVPTLQQCGFAVTQPSFLPNGFQFQSSFIMPIKGQKLVGLNYANGLITLSIFEQPYNQRPGAPPDKDQIRSPRQNVVTAQHGGYRYIIVGSIPGDVLQQVALSMK